MMDVEIKGIGCVDAPGTPHLNKSFKDLLVEAVYRAISDADIEPDDIDGASFSYGGESEVGYGSITPTLVDALGLSSIPAYINISNCASAHSALMQGYDMIQTGNYNCVIVAGFDKYTDVIPFENYMLLSTDSMFDYNLGFSHIDAFLFQNEYFRKYGISSKEAKESLLAFAKLARKNASKNTVASLYNTPIPSDKMLEKLPFFGSTLQAGEGASAVILTPVSKESNGRNRVTIAGTGFITTSHYIAHRYEPGLMKQFDDNESGDISTGLPLKMAVDQAYKSANCNATDIDMIELYDQGINEFISLEASGICKPGTATKFILEGNGEVDGKCPVNTDGGNIGRGHAAGGASLYQIIEIVKQMQRRSTGVQVSKDLHLALSTVIGGAFATSIAVVLKNMDWGE